MNVVQRLAERPSGRSALFGRSGGGFLRKALVALLCAMLLGALPSPAAARQAAELMRRCEDVLRVERSRLGLFDPETDPDGSGLIGVEFSPLTTTLGDLADKRASARPEMADAVEAYLQRAGTASGDWIAVNASGSFPGYSLAVLCAAEVMGLKVRMVLSYGSSMYGGTTPGFTFPVMLDLLNRRGLLRTRLAAVSPGGAGDRLAETLLEDPWPTVRSLMDSRSEPSIEEPSLSGAIRRRLDIFDAPPGVRCFVSCGGPATSLGAEGAGEMKVLSLGHGLLRKPASIPQNEERGLIYEYLARGVPVVHLLFTRGICADFGIPYEAPRGRFSAPFDP